jgi:signal transduction histidine kinase
MKESVMHFSLPTYFASAKRASGKELQHSMEIACMNPVVDGIMQSVGGMIAVLNEYRQILAVNDALLSRLGIDDGGPILGLRIGEVLRCEHAREMPGGCGTSRYCSSCGAAVAVQASISDGMTVERKCVLSVVREGRNEELCLAVRAHPLLLENRRFTLLFLQDITQQEWRAALERVFFYDIDNTLQGLVGSSYMMDYLDDGDLRKMVKPLQLMVSRLSKEVKIERTLAGRDMRSYRPQLQMVQVPEVVEEIRSVFFSHPVAEGKRLAVSAPIRDLQIRTDPALLARVLINMIKNAFEATEGGDEVRLQIRPTNGSLSFDVWNRQPIPEAVALRIFKRHFSTKAEEGRGFGTYSMKLIGEELLGGKVYFSSTAEEGTVFSLTVTRIV